MGRVSDGLTHIRAVSSMSLVCSEQCGHFGHQHPQEKNGILDFKLLLYRKLRGMQLFFFWAFVLVMFLKIIYFDCGMK